MNRVEEFWVVSSGATAREAFDAAVRAAIAESPSAKFARGVGTKDDFAILRVPLGQEPEEFARELLDRNDERVADPWGRACCVSLASDHFLFFGRWQAK